MTFLVGSAIYGVGFVICADVSLTYVLDCYQNVSSIQIPPTQVVLKRSNR